MISDYCEYPPRVADHVEATEDRDGDRPAYIVGSATVSRYLLLRVTEYNVLGLLSQSRTPRAVCDEFKQRYGATLSLPTLVNFLARLDDVGILAGQRGHRPDAWGQLSGSPYLRVTLFNPDRLFAWMVSGLRWIWTKGFLIFTLALMLIALWFALMNWVELVSYSGQMLREHYVAILIAGLLVGLSHEFAHGLTCKAFGGRATEVGVLMIYYFLPALYCNVSGIHLIRQRHRRLWVIAAGIYWQLLVGTAALFLWFVFAPHTLLSNVALVFFLGSVLDLLINANPLIKLDGYYFLSQWLRLPNLMARSRAYWRCFWQWIVFGEHEDTEPRYGRSERGIYAVFGVLSSLYIVALLGTVVWFVGGYLVDSFYLVGLLLTTGIALWYIRRPLNLLLSAGAALSARWAKMIWREDHSKKERGQPNHEPPKAKQLFSSFVFHHSFLLNRRRFLLAALLLLIIGTMLVPWPASVGNYGTLCAIPDLEAIIRAPENAVLTDLRVHPGDRLASGAAVGRLGSVELEDQVAEAQSELARAKTAHNRLQGELGTHEEAAGRAEVQWRQRQHDYDELSAEQKQIQAKRAGIFVNRSEPEPLYEPEVRSSAFTRPVPPEGGTPSGRALPEMIVQRSNLGEPDLDAVPSAKPTSQALGVRTNYPAAIAVLEADVDLHQARLAEANSQLDRARQLAAQSILAREELQTAETRSATLTIELKAARQRLEAALIDHRRKHTSAYTEMLLARSDLKAEQMQIKKLDGEICAMRTVLNTLEQRLDLLQRRQAQFELSAPRAGTVFGEDLPRQVGQHFPKGAEICRIAETHQLLVRIQVPETEIGDLQIGNPVRLKARAFPDHLFRGVVSKIGGESESDEHHRMTYRLELTIENSAELLRPGMTAFARIDFDRQIIGRILLHKLKQALRPELWMV